MKLFISSLHLHISKFHIESCVQWKLCAGHLVREDHRFKRVQARTEYCRTKVLDRSLIRVYLLESCNSPFLVDLLRFFPVGFFPRTIGYKNPCVIYFCYKILLVKFGIEILVQSYSGYLFTLPEARFQHENQDRRP